MLNEVRAPSAILPSKAQFEVTHKKYHYLFYRGRGIPWKLQKALNFVEKHFFLEKIICFSIIACNSKNVLENLLCYLVRMKRY